MRRLAGLALITLVAACGGGASIETTNAETFATSLREMTATLPQDEQRAAGTGLLLVLEEASPDATPSVGTLRRARRDGLDVLPSADPDEAAFLREVYREMIDVGGEALDGMSVRDLARYAEDYEERAFAADLAAVEAEREALAARIDAAAAKGAERDAEVERLTEAANAPLRLAADMIGDVDLGVIEPGANRVSAQPSVTVTNRLAFPIDLLNVRIELAAPGRQKPLVGIMQTYLSRTDEGVLAPGETRTITTPGPLRLASYERGGPLPDDADAYELTATVGQARGQGEAWSAQPDRQAQSAQMQAERLRDGCVSAVTSARERAAGLAAQAEALRAGTIAERRARFSFGTQLESCV